MTEKEFIQKLSDSVKDVPSRIDIPVLRQFSPAIAQGRAERFTRLMAAHDNRFAGKTDRVVQPQRTLFRLALNARLEVHHASGDLRFVGGLEPMDALHSKVGSKEELIRSLEATAKKINLKQWAGQGEDIQFERLWQIKAASVDQQGKTSEPVLCRAVGAYRHMVGKFPVLGAASATIKLADKSQIDSVMISVRETTEQRLGTEQVSRVDDAAKQLYAQLATLMGKSKTPVYEMATPQWVRFGYLSQSRRQSQRMLMPVFMAAIDVKADDMAQGYILTVPATSNPLLAPYLRGADVPADLEKRGNK